MSCSHKVCTKDKGCICLLSMQKAKCKLCLDKTPMSLQEATDIVLEGKLLYTDEESMRIIRGLTEKLNENDKLTFTDWYNKNVI